MGRGKRRHKHRKPRLSKGTPRVSRLQKLITTTEDWYPNLDSEGIADREGRYIRVSFVKYRPQPQYWPRYGVSISSGDDSYMTYYSHTREEAEWVYNHVKNDILKKELERMGFENG